MQSNPVQNRVDALVEKWNETRANEEVKLVRILHKKEESDMIDTFFTYLMSEEAPSPDVPVLFDRPIQIDLRQYAKESLQLLHGYIEIWNRATHADGSQNDSIDWKPDYSKGKDNRNPAALFIENLNELVAHLEMDEEMYMVAIFNGNSDPVKYFLEWWEAVFTLEVHPQIKFAVADRTDRRLFDALISKFPQESAVIIPDLRVDTMMGQIAAMGDPADPVIQYRKSFVALSQGLQKRDSKAVAHHAGECLRIAEAQILKDPLWYGQILVVNTVLCNDQIGYKNWKKAIDFATVGVEEMQKAESQIQEPYIIQKMQGQARMTRGAVFTADEQWQHAQDDFEAAANLYILTQDPILAIEAFRMQGFVLMKIWKRAEAAAALVKGFKFALDSPKEVLVYSTFPGLVEQMLDTPYRKWIPEKEVNQFLISIYGNDWKAIISNWKTPDLTTQSTQITEVVPV